MTQTIPTTWTEFAVQWRRTVGGAWGEVEPCADSVAALSINDLYPSQTRVVLRDVTATAWRPEGGES